MISKPIHTVYKWLLSVSLAVAGVCLIIACVGIYLSGERPFSPEAVAIAFQGIAIPVFLCLALVIGGFLIDIFSDKAPAKLNAHAQYAHRLAKLREKLDRETCQPELKKAMCRQRTLRRDRRTFALSLLAVCGAAFADYCLHTEYFDSHDINGSMIRAVQVFALCLVIPFGYSLFAAYSCRRSVLKEIELVKQAIAAGAVKTADAPSPSKQKLPWARILRYYILAVSIVMLVYGFFSGGTADVLTKAVNICTECVGLG